MGKRNCALSVVLIFVDIVKERGGKYLVKLKDTLLGLVLVIHSAVQHCRFPKNSI